MKSGIIILRILIKDYIKIFIKKNVYMVSQNENVMIFLNLNDVFFYRIGIKVVELEEFSFSEK